MSSMNRDLALAILKHCFPEADTIRIIHMTLQDGERHFQSDVNRLIVEYEQDRIIQRKHLIMKVPISRTQSSLFEKLNIYDKEINMYEKVLPQMNKYLDKSLAPAHLYSTDSKILVLEDLTARGYKSGEKFPLLNLLQIEAVMKAFAHLHAASCKLYEEDPNILTNFLPHSWVEANLRNPIHFWAMVVLEVLEKKNETHLISKIKAVILFLKKDEDEIRDLVDQSKFKFAVLNHGDGRKDNLLFKHAPENREMIQFVDYQLCFISSPANDIIYFLVTSVSMGMIGANLDVLIDEYLFELNIKLKQLECASTYERADFDEDFKSLRYFLFVFFFYLCSFNSPLSREQLEDSYVQPEADASYLCDLCLSKEKFVNFVDDWIKYFEKSKILDEF